MNILYLDLNIQYVNPTRNNIPLLLKNIANLDIYGAGYQSSKILEDGPDKFYEKNGPYDFIITNEHIVFGTQNMISDYNLTINAYQRNYNFKFNAKLIMKTLNKMYDFFEKVNCNKVIFLLESDYYNFQTHKIDRLKKLDAYIVGLGKQFSSHTNELKYLKHEVFAEKSNNNWYDFVSVSDDKLMSLYHFVNSSEFYFESIESRKNIIYIPGVNYYLRKKALNNIKQSKKYSIDDKKIYNKIYILLSKIGIKPYSHPILMKLYNQLFRNQIENTKYIYTCGSGLDWPLRKFFEIPALGSLLLATPFKNAKDMGFVDMKTYAECNYENILKKVDYLENNPKEAQIISKNAQDLVWDRHSLNARTKQLIQCFSAILNNSFNGTYWKDGEFYVK